LPADTIALEWRTIYTWLQRHVAASEWAARAARYFEVAEAKLIDSKQFVEGALTMFSGIPFGSDHPFTYLEGKRILSLAMGELRQRRDLQRELGMNPSTSGRPATKRCDYLALDENAPILVIDDPAVWNSPAVTLLFPHFLLTRVLLL
jgi:hypothetical protein